MELCTANAILPPRFSVPTLHAACVRNLKYSVPFPRFIIRTQRKFDSKYYAPTVSASVNFYAVNCVVLIAICDAGRRGSGPRATVSDGRSCEAVDESRMHRVCDKLIGVFMVDKPTPTDWRRADAEEDPAMKEKLLRLARKLKQIDEDVQRHNELIEVVKRDPSQISEIVSKRRKDFTEEFFIHLHTVAESYYDNKEKQNELAKLGNSCLAAVQAYDAATENIEQVKDILFHLYKTAVGNLQKLVPKEIRIVKYLIQIDDPEEQLSALKDAFTPGEELEGKDVDNLYTTPEKLHTWIKSVVDAYHLSREGTLIREARDLLSPEIIQKLEGLKMIVERNFM
ncbi:hypothetical protein ACSQ67_012489 [Phaseolus vulgaris]